MSPKPVSGQLGVGRLQMKNPTDPNRQEIPARKTNDELFGSVLQKHALPVQTPVHAFTAYHLNSAATPILRKTE
jgi:hypothetical protein